MLFDAKTLLGLVCRVRMTSFDVIVIIQPSIISLDLSTYFFYFYF